MEKNLIYRLLHVPEYSFFLFGPRGVGKTTYLREVMPGAIFFDLLEASLNLELSINPGRLEAMIGTRPKDSWVVIDEIQKIPALLDEVHRLIENKGWKFALCGSSARKLRRGGVNLLAGRAVTRSLDTFSFGELGQAFDIEFSLEWGLLPWIQMHRDNPTDFLSAYVDTYIKEEIKEESIVRSLPPFLRFLSIAGQLNGQMVNGQNIAREAGVARSSVDVYFSILEDTLLGHFLPAYKPGAKVREQTHPKFFWFDPGVARAAAGLLFDPVDRIWKGSSLETLILHELKVYNQTQEKHRGIYFYRTGSGVEIDFVVETKKRQQSSNPHIVCIEVKMAEKWNSSWEKPMRSLNEYKGIHVDRMIGIYNGTRVYHYDGVDVLPVKEFLEQLHRGKVF
ncbi:MAG: AAA family ATPase [Proteobacteria bacterium]|nr:AAA family ATPase [Pseudomonadota bacterium]